MTKLDKIYESRPFRTRNADEYQLENILELFVDPTKGLIGPFDYTNIIVKGKMGSGKTMYLRANQAYYLYTMVPCLLEEVPLKVPIYIRMSDLHITQSNDNIYESIIVKIIQEFTNIYKHLESAERMSNLHKGFQALNTCFSSKSDKTLEVIDNLNRLTCEEYVEKVSNVVGHSGKVNSKFFEGCTTYNKEKTLETRGKKRACLDDLIDAYNKLLKPYNGEILLLLDEMGSLPKDFFKEDNGNSTFEELMNQFRTLPFIRTKVAIYPNSIADILNETRYGDVVELESNVFNGDYDIFLNKTITLIEKYVQKELDDYTIRFEDLFDNTDYKNEAVEQLIYTSDGNIRRLVHLIDMAMEEAYVRSNGKTKIMLIDIINAMIKQSKGLESNYTRSELDILNNIVSVCKSRGAYMFMFPNNSIVINKYVNKSYEYNIINVVELGAGRKSTTYAFDYGYCIYKDIPTHYLKGTERLDKLRSRETGEKIKKVTKITENLLEQADISGKIEAEIVFVGENKDVCFAKDENSVDYFITNKEVIEDDKDKKFIVGKRLRFIAVNYDNFISGCEVEIL